VLATSGERARIPARLAGVWRGCIGAVRQQSSRSFNRHLLVTVYFPTALLAFGQGAMVPILPLYARQFSASYSLAGLAVSAAWIGTLMMDVPVGLLLPRIGHRRAMVIGCGLFAAGTIALAFAHSAPELIIYRLLAGIGTAFWGLSRHAYIAQAVPVESRGRVISVFGGINRLGWFVGPAVGGFVGRDFGLSTAILVAGILALGATGFAIAVPELPNLRPAPGAHRLSLAVISEIIQLRWRELLTAGTAQIFAQMIRQARYIVIPLYGRDILGLDAAQVGVIISASSFLDMSLFIPAGMIMDRWGRKAAAIPSFLLLGLGMGLIPFTTSYWTLCAAGLLIGFGNGIGSGTMMTLGADLAPEGRTGEFLGIWRLIGDSGQALSPLAVGLIADLIGITLTSGATALLGLFAASTLGFFVQETRWAQSRSTPPAEPLPACHGASRLAQSPLPSTTRKRETGR